VALSYYPPGTANPSAAARSAVPGAGLGWPERPLTSWAHSARSAGAARNGGLGWPGNLGSVPIMSAPIMSGQSAGQESRGVLVNEARSEADGGEVRETFGSGTGAQRPDQAATAVSRKTSDQAATAVSRKTSSVVIPDIPPDPADTPIARAAEAAVGVRGGGQPWPRPPRCRIMTIANQKGGVGKTTTAVNLAASLALHGSRVLVVDLDPQGNASTALDVAHHIGVPSVYDVLVDDRPLAEVVRPAGEMPGLYCAPATIDLAGAEIELVPVVARELRLTRALKAYDMSNLDYVLVDCPPSLGLLTLNALVAAEEVLLPIQCEYYALEGVQQLLNTAELVRVNFNPGLHVSTVLLTMYDGRTRLASDVADDVRAHFGASVLSTIIPRSVRVSEAPSRGQSVITYDPASSGAIAYTEAAHELALQSVGAH
jgi:chromosome partitioning protein